MCLHLFGGGGDLRTQEEGSKEVRGGSKVTGNKRSITEQFPAGNNWRSILPGHSEDAREGASLAKTPGTLGALLCSRFERKVHRKLFTIQQRPRKGGSSRRSGVGGRGGGCRCDCEKLLGVVAVHQGHTKMEVVTSECQPWRERL